MTFFTLDFSCRGAMRDSGSEEPQEPPAEAVGQESLDLQESQEAIFFTSYSNTFAPKDLTGTFQAEKQTRNTPGA
jgi:hypothetical protein